jgi:hypothetical protein
MGLTLIEAAKDENRLEHLAVFKTVSEATRRPISSAGVCRQVVGSRQPQALVAWLAPQTAS